MARMSPLRQIALLPHILLPVAAWAQIGNIVVTNGASFKPGLPPNGSVAAAFCTGLTVNGVVTAPGLPLPTSLSGVTVTIRGVAAPLFAIADLGNGEQQIDFQVPQEIGSYPVDMPFVISQNGTQGVLTMQPSAATPGEFFRLGATQFGIFQHSSDYSLVTTDNPATSGETIIAYLTGLPPATPPVPDGQPAPAVPLSIVPQTSLSLTGPFDQLGISLGGNPQYPNLPGPFLLYDPPPVRGDSTGLSPIPFIGLAPGMVGVYQINFTLPDFSRVTGFTSSGAIPVQLARDLCPNPTIFSDCYPEFYNVSYSQPVLLPVR